MNDRENADQIVEEIHQTRRAIAEKFGHDVAAISEAARKRQDASGREVGHRRDSTESIPSAT